MYKKEMMIKRIVCGAGFEVVFLSLIKRKLVFL